MILDGSLTFNSAVGTPQAISATAASSGIVDVTGAGSGNLPTMINGFPAANTAVGSDYGAGDGNTIPHVLISVTTAGTGTGTIQIALEWAPDNGSGSPGTYTLLVETDALVGSTLVKGTVIDIPVPPATSLAGESLPRFYKLEYTVSGTAGVSVLANMVLNPEQAYQMSKYSNNYIVV